MYKMDNLKFKISTGLKNIIGSELITDKHIAIFELVKNSYDAGAHRVDIVFNDISSQNASIIVSDNGLGMDENDLVNKWLFVAYSEKNSKRRGTYRDEYTKRVYAGAKGVGRFSCDRLGSYIELYSRKSSKDNINLLRVDWSKFENDDQEEFINIPVEHEYVSEFPNDVEKGTCIVIHNLRDKWDRASILEIKKDLSRLINPFVNIENNDSFEIHISCDEEKAIDDSIEDEKNKVNGIVKNHVFEALDLKTTHISVSISEDGRKTTTKMSDRGTFLFELEQNNTFNLLENIDVELFYLNRSAKLNFHKYMGLPVIDFGSIFVYKNGFRIMPYGEPGSDKFGLDRRKTQGHSRFLGTRDLMGRISILGDNPDFVETSSRAGGFINSNAFDELLDFFKKIVLVPLEKYVIKLISWGDPIKNDNKEVIRGPIMPEEIKSDIIKYITNYDKKGTVNLIAMNDDLHKIIEERKNKQQTTDINALKQIAEKTDNTELSKIAIRVEKQTLDLRKDKNALEKQVNSVTEELEKTESELKLSQNQALFLRGLSNPDKENVIKALHSIATSAISIKDKTDSLFEIIMSISDFKGKEKIKEELFEIKKITKEIENRYHITLKANYDMRNDNREVNLYDFISGFIDNVFMRREGKLISINIFEEKKNIYYTINPVQFGIVIENILYNSYKAGAKKVNIRIDSLNDYIEITFSDDGNGLDKIITNPEKIFEMGFTTTKNGTGVGLAHSREIVNKMNGQIFINEKEEKGFELKVRLKK